MSVIGDLGLTSFIITEQLMEHTGWNHQPSSILTSWTSCECHQGHEGHVLICGAGIPGKLPFQKYSHYVGNGLKEHRRYRRLRLQGGDDKYTLSSPGSHTASQSGLTQKDQQNLWFSSHC